MANFDALALRESDEPVLSRGVLLGARGAPQVMERTANPKPSRGTHARAKARAKRQQAKLLRAVIAAVDARDKKRCSVCGIYCGASIHHHHVVYRSLGGRDTVENLLSVCQRCHAGIHARQIQAEAMS